jgi:hypothetical protein
LKPQIEAARHRHDRLRGYLSPRSGD